MRRLLPILFFTVLFAAKANAQAGRTGPSSEISDRIVKLYPNPATSFITFDLQKGYERGMTIEIYSFVGKKMSNLSNAPQKTTIDLTEYNRGIYMYHLLDASGKVIESGKFQVTK